MQEFWFSEWQYRGEKKSSLHHLMSNPFERLYKCKGERDQRLNLVLFPTHSAPLWDRSSKIHFCHDIAILGCRGMAGMWSSMERYCDHGVTKISWGLRWPFSISTENMKYWPYADLHPKPCCWFVRGGLVGVGICSLLNKTGRSFGKFSCQSLMSVHWTYSVFNFSLFRVFYSHWLEHFHKCTRLACRTIFSDNFKSLSRGMEMWNLLRKMPTNIFLSKEKNNLYTFLLSVLKCNDIFVVAVQTDFNLSQAFDVENLFTSLTVVRDRVWVLYRSRENFY